MWTRVDDSQGALENPRIFSSATLVTLVRDMPPDRHPSEPAIAPGLPEQAKPEESRLTLFDEIEPSESNLALDSREMPVAEAPVNKEKRPAPPPPPRVTKREPPPAQGMAIPPVPRVSTGAASGPDRGTLPPPRDTKPPLPRDSKPAPGRDATPSGRSLPPPLPPPRETSAASPQARLSAFADVPSDKHAQPSATLGRPRPSAPPLPTASARSGPAAGARGSKQAGPARPSGVPSVPSPDLSIAATMRLPAPERTERITLVDAEGPITTLGAPAEIIGEPSGTPLAEAAKQLIARCEADLAHSPPPPPARSARLHYEIARLCEYPLRDAKRAATHYQHAFERAPEHLPTIRGLRRTLVARRALKQALPLFDAEARLTSDPRAKAKIFLAKGRLYEDGLALRNEARQAYRIAADLDPMDPAALEAIEQAELLAEEWPELSVTYGKQANALEADPKQRSALLVRRAQILESKLSDPEGAIAQYEIAFELDSESHDALDALKRLYYVRGRFRDLVRVLELQAARSTTPWVRATALYQVARIQSDKLANRPDSVATLERALDATPHDRLLLEELAQLREASRDYRGLTAVLSQMVDTLESPVDQASMLHRIGHLYNEHLADPDSARGWLERALRVDPCYLPALQALGNLYTARGMYPQLVAMYLAEADATPDSKRRAAAYARVADVCEIRLEDRDAAIEHHRRALSAVPVFAASFKALSRLYSEARRFSELIELYERAVEHAESDRAIAYLAKIGALYEDQLSDPVQAIHAYRRILDKDPRNLLAIHSLERATEAAGRFGDLVEMLVLEAELTQDRTHKVALLARAADVLDTQLNDLEGAIGLLRKVISIDARYVPALSTLGGIYYRAGRWEDLLSTYQAELNVLADDPRAVSLLVKMAELTEQRLGRHTDATDLYRRAALLDASSLVARQAYARKLREQNRWDELIEVLSREAKATSSSVDRGTCFFRMGEVLEFRLNRVDAALDAYDKALAEDGKNRVAREAQLRLRTQRGDFGRLAEELMREANLIDEPHARLAVLMRVGELYRDQLRDLRRSIACFSEALSIDPGHHGALIALESLYRKTGQWTELASILAAESRHFNDPAARATALRELVRVELRSEADSDTLRGSYASILEIIPDDADALVGLEGVALAEGDEELLRSVDERIAGSASDRGLRSHHLTRLAELAENEDPVRALSLYRAALDADPENLAATRGTSRLSRRGDDPEALAGAALREADVLGDTSAAADLWVRAALARRKQGQDARAVSQDLERALELEPDNAAAAYHLSEVLLGVGDAQRLSDVLSRAASGATQKPRAAALWREVARLHADSLNNVAGAISALNRALRNAPDDVALLSDLAILFRRDGQWNEAAQLLMRVVALAKDSSLLREAHMELAGIHDERLGDSAQALDHFRAALKISPDDVIVLERLSDLLSRERQHAEAIAIAKRLVEACRMPTMRVLALIHLARVEKRRGDASGAAKALAEAVAIDGPSGGAGAAFREMIGHGATHADYAAALRKHISSLRSGAGAPIEVILELARVQANELQAPAEALSTLREGLAKHHSSVSLRVEHARQLRAMGALEETANELRLLLVLDLERAQTWKDLGDCFEAMNRPDAKARVSEALSVLGGRSTAEARVKKQHVDLSRVRAAAMAGPVIDELSHDLMPFDVTGELLVGLAEGIVKLYPPDLEGYGVSTRDRLSPRSGHPFRSMADRIAEIVGAGEFDLYVHRARIRGIGVELGETPSLLFPAWLLEQSEAHQVFALARTLTLVARGSHAILKLTPRELEVTLASYARTSVAGFGRGLTSEDLLEDQGKRIYKALSRKARKVAEEAAQRYVVTTPHVDFVRWVDSRERVATRVGALLCDDLLAAVEGMLRARSDAPSRETVVDVRDETVRDLLRFWVSEQALRSRTRAGLGAA
jgi:tetratricopeptide (TPR) repeat protein